MSPRDTPRRADRPVGITVIGQDRQSWAASNIEVKKGHVEQVRAIFYFVSYLSPSWD